MLWKNQFFHVSSIFSGVRVLRISYYSPILKSQKIIQVGKDIGRSLVQALAQSRGQLWAQTRFPGTFSRHIWKNSKDGDCNSIHRNVQMTVISEW